MCFVIFGLPLWLGPPLWGFLISSTNLSNCAKVSSSCCVVTCGVPKVKVGLLLLVLVEIGLGLLVWVGLGLGYFLQLLNFLIIDWVTIGPRAILK